VTDIVNFNALQFFDGPLHDVGFLAAEVCHLVLEDAELMWCCGITLLLDEGAHAVVSYSGV